MWKAMRLQGAVVVAMLAVGVSPGIVAAQNSGDAAKGQKAVAEESATSPARTGEVVSDAKAPALTKESVDVLGARPSEDMKESDQPEKTSSIFEDLDVRQLLGETPRFVYLAKERPDPMVLPWVRKEIIFKELQAEGNRLVAALGTATDDGAFKAARSVFEKMKALDIPEYALLADSKLAEIQKLERQRNLILNPDADPNTIQPPAPDPVLEPWVVENTKGILHMPEGSMAVVGDDMLSEGEKLPLYPNHMVYRIEADTVVFRVDGKKDFPIKLVIR